MSRRGFTMIELLVVMTIMVILMAIVLPGIFGGKRQADKAVARNLITALETAIGAYENAYGGPPPSGFAALKQARNSAGGSPWKACTSPTNDTNEGIECLVLALTTAQGGIEPFEWKEDQIENTDDDGISGVTQFEIGDGTRAVEAVDPWGNPFVYIHHTQYGQKVRIKLGEGGEGRTIDVQAQKSEKLGGYHKKREYQLFSLGPDGEPGTADDIGNWG
jgi:prepilin-type N-terminal cleavage/methylation domain-containing protein